MSGVLLSLPSHNVSYFFQFEVTRISSNVIYAIYWYILEIIQMAACLVDIMRILTDARQGRECCQYPLTTYHVVYNTREWSRVRKNYVFMGTLSGIM